MRWTSPAALMTFGLIACGLGQLGTGFIGAETAPMRILPGMVLAGAANGLLNAALGQQAIASVPPERAAMGSGANNTARYLGSAFGLTLGALLMTGVGGAAAMAAGWNRAVDAGAGLSFLGAVLIFALQRMKSRPAIAVPGR